MQIVSMEVNQHARIIKESDELVQNSEKLDTRLSRCDVVVQHLNSLLEYQRKGIVTIQPEPSELLESYRGKRNEIVNDELSKIVEQSIQKAELKATPRTAVNEINRAIEKVRNIGSEYAAGKQAEAAEERLQRHIHRITFEGFVEAAKKAEFKGKTSKAIDQYQEALYLLKTDDIPDHDQAEEIRRLESKIADLQGE